MSPHLNRDGQRPLTIARKGLLLIAVPLLFQLVLLAMLAVMETWQEAERDLELRSKDVVSSANRLVSVLIDAETGTRGYLLTRNQQFAEPFLAAQRELPIELERLRGLTASRLSTHDLARAATAVIDYHRTAHRRIERGQIDEVFATTRAEVGKNLMQRFRREMVDFLDRESLLAAAAQRSSQRARQRLMAVIAFGFVANIALAVLTARLFKRGITRRISVLLDNMLRLERGEPLRALDGGNDEIAELDRRFHEMAAGIARARNELETANEELESFSYSVSHDLRAPLRAVNGYAQMLEEDYGGAIDGDGKRFIETIRREADRMGALIDDLLAFSRLGRRPVQMVSLDVGALAREVFAALNATNPGRFVRLECGDLPPAMGDPPMVRQVLVNLLGNAVKFSVQRPDAVVQIGGSEGDGLQTFWVRDNGVGFDMAYVDKVFGVFQRLHDSEEFEGTGVGLAIVQRVVERHGGRVWAEGKVGEGACFYFTLPAVAERKNAA